MLTNTNDVSRYAQTRVHAFVAARRPIGLLYADSSYRWNPVRRRSRLFGGRAPLLVQLVAEVNRVVARPSCCASSVAGKHHCRTLPAWAHDQLTVHRVAQLATAAMAAHCAGLLGDQRRVGGIPQLAAAAHHRVMKPVERREAFAVLPQHQRLKGSLGDRQRRWRQRLDTALPREFAATRGLRTPRQVVGGVCGDKRREPASLRRWRLFPLTSCDWSAA
jgi:hypothetical protein